MKKIEKILGYSFTNTDLLQQALTHSSKGGKEFQRLEFLGDRVLNISLTILLLEMYTNAKEGDLAKRLSALASAQCLHTIALVWELDTQMKCTPTQINAVLSDSCEAILGAVFLDCNKNLDIILSIVEKFWHDFLVEDKDYDPKTRLQEIAYKLFKISPIYDTVLIQGKDHKPIFGSTVHVLKKIGIGKGGSIKEAEKAAASDVLKKINY